MTVMEFILVAHAILTGLGIAEILRGFGDLIRGTPVRISRRLIGVASWALLVYFGIWWAVWRVGHRDSWTFPDFLLMLLPVVILYLIARLSFPKEIDDADLAAYYRRVSPALWMLIAATFFSFAIFSPTLYGAIVPELLASQLGISGAALVAVKVRKRWFQLGLIILMLAQTIWRGLVLTIGG